MTPLYLILLPFCISMLLVLWIHPRLVKIALMKEIVDCPDARKLQRRPVPVLGGVAVFFGIVCGVGVVGTLEGTSGLFSVTVAMMIMLYTGTMDDILDLSPSLRFLIEICAVLLLFFVGGYCIDDFHGLWGLGVVPFAVALPLTLFAAVGIINAINLIDGVNGLSSGYGILSSLIFGVLFYSVGDTKMALLAAVTCGSLIPFFLHNVFGRYSKMFIGDGGTLVLGVVLSVYVTATLRHDSVAALYVAPDIGLIPFTLAVLAVPVFDTLRVMSTRIRKGRSPFSPDKTHLHHMFIELGCSHAMVTLAILLLNASVVVVWGTAALLGASIAVQLYLVVALGLVITFGLYQFAEWHLRRRTRFLRTLRRIGYALHISRTRGFLRLQHWIDRL
ncbi:MraY family glycosyltransferase [uncultured Alistipes sp.]|uniref:MraY family glycosyltransferase n=1 Tax=uncultured Alistipes sp. TaxID=538949 RepID=UPI0026F31BB2|nr:MraY family glycosyltransferase [uncultured Alistipes sp.]